MAIEIDSLVPKTLGIAPACFGCELQDKDSDCILASGIRSYYKDIARGSVLREKVEKIVRLISKSPSDCPIKR